MTEKEAGSLAGVRTLPSKELRGELRVATTAAVFVELSAGDPITGEAASIVMCRLLDVSAAGMRIRIDRAVPLGTILSLCARFNGPKQGNHSSLRVVGEVRWVEKQDNYYLIGLFLYESFDTDITAWKLLIADQI
ncbi:MAG: PilZ domain-containing protein [Gammaproteobacteria bacterium]|nr:PilZ domain-containing protein [Gammaproteobacteria bacterium]MBQ0773070.1 PilZ domain-containing protein [Gammaproteobacteria bacterium]|tara:strand:- start:119497 stop:119901 length:405 start_codon:yes stop_codon:yes gene_type:complete